MPTRWHLKRSMLAVLGIMLLAALLNLMNISAIGDANTYYTAAIKAMLQSPSNFFFVAAEPGASVSIDKPPLGLWLQALSALFLGVNGFAVVLPQILAGILSVPLLYGLVSRWFGVGAGLVAALVMAIMPVSVAVQRNNTMDATLIFTLLLATWAFIRATETGKFRWLMLGGVLVGLGFNIKMLQAFLPLPALYAVYFWGAKHAWGKKLVHLAATSLVLLAVSLAWVVAVDLTPPENRPYVGGSETNSALELALGYNGLQRLLGAVGARPNNASDNANTAGAGQNLPPTGSPPWMNANGQGFVSAMGAPNAGGMFAEEVGTAGVLRLFSSPLDNETGWFLPLGLFSLGLLVLAERPRLPLSIRHQAALLWGGCLLTEIVFFSMAGFFHAYYLAMLTPPLAALVGIGFMRLWGMYQQDRFRGGIALLGALGLTLIYQISIAARYSDMPTWLILPVVAWAMGSILLLAGRFMPRWLHASGMGLGAMVLSLMLIPGLWTAAGSLQSTTNAVLPSAYGGMASMLGRGGMPPLPSLANNTGAGGALPLDGDGAQAGFAGEINQALLEYLEANTTGMRWMMAVASSQQGSGYVLASGRGVLYMGGFNGSDPVISTEQLQTYVATGALRYVLTMGPVGWRLPFMDGQSAIYEWVSDKCSTVSDLSVNGATLYDCAAS